MSTQNPTDVVLRPVVRFTLYLIGSLGSVVFAYTTAKGWTGDAEIVAWGGVVAIIQGLAAANVPSRPRMLRRSKAPVVDEGGYGDPRLAVVLAVAALAVAILALFIDRITFR